MYYLLLAVRAVLRFVWYFGRPPRPKLSEAEIEARKVAAYKKHRLVYTYFDGKQYRKGDPLHIYRLLRNDEEFNIDEHPTYVDAGDDEATGILCRAVCRAFDVKPYNDITQEGLQDAELLNLFGDLGYYLEDLQKKTSNGPILSPPTESKSSAGEADPRSTTKPLSA